MSINKQLAEAFTREVFNVLRETPGYDIYQAISIAAQRPAPQFYVRSFDCAALYVTRLLHGKKLPLRNPLKVAMYEEIYRRYLPRHSGRRVNLDILREIIQQPAPSYYRAEATLLVLFYRHQRKEI